MNEPLHAKVRFAVWGAVAGLACGVFITPLALVFVPAIHDATRAAIMTILAAGAMGAIVGLFAGIMKDAGGAL